MDDRTRAPRAVDGDSVGLRGCPEEKAFRPDDMAAGELAWELSGGVLEIVFEADGTGLVFDFVWLEQLGCFEESFEVDGHG